MRYKVDGLTRTVLTFAAAMIGLVIIAFFASSASAQDAIDVQQDIDIATVNQKAEDAKGKAMGVEGRLSVAEGTITNHGSEVSALATGQASLNTQLGNVDARVSALETAPGANQAQVDSNTSRIAALESQPAPSVTKWAVRDALGTLVGTWSDQSGVGQGMLNGHSFSVSPVEWRWNVIDNNRFYLNDPTCSDVPWTITKDENGNPFNVIPTKPFTGPWLGFVHPATGDLYTPTGTEIYKTGVQWYRITATGQCAGAWGPTLQVYAVPYVLAELNPGFTPPFNVVQE